MGRRSLSWVTTRGIVTIHEFICESYTKHSTANGGNDPALLPGEDWGDTAGLAGDVKDIGITGGCIFAGSENAEHADVVMLHDVEGAPFAMTLLLRSGEERHLVF